MSWGKLYSPLILRCGNPIVTEYNWYNNWLIKQNKAQTSDPLTKVNAKTRQGDYWDYYLSCNCSTVHRGQLQQNISRLRAHTRLSDGNKNKDDLIYRYFHASGHHGLKDVSNKLIDNVPHESKLLLILITTTITTTTTTTTTNLYYLYYLVIKEHLSSYK